MNEEDFKEQGHAVELGVPGFNNRQLQLLYKAVSEVYNQRGPHGYASIVRTAQKLVQTNAVEMDDATKEQFLAQSPESSARYSCTTINKRMIQEALYLIAQNTPDYLHNVAEWLATVSGPGGVIAKDVNGVPAFCWLDGPGFPERDIQGERTLMQPYVQDYKYWEIDRRQFPTDDEILAEFKRMREEGAANGQYFHAIGIREHSSGDRSKGHSIAAVLDETGTYRLLDSYFTQRTGEPMQNHFGAGKPRWLHMIYGYTTV